MDEHQAASEAKSAEAINAIAVAEEARQRAAHASLVSALKEVFVDDDHSPILVKSRIQRLCDSYDSLLKSQLIIQNDTKWTKWIAGVSLGIIVPVLGFFGILVIDNSQAIAAIKAEIQILLK